MGWSSAGEARKGHSKRDQHVQGHGAMKQCGESQEFGLIEGSVYAEELPCPNNNNITTITNS